MTKRKSESEKRPRGRPPKIGPEEKQKRRYARQLYKNAMERGGIQRITISSVTKKLRLPLTKKGRGKTKGNGGDVLDNWRKNPVENNATLPPRGYRVKRI